MNSGRTSLRRLAMASLLALNGLAVPSSAAETKAATPKAADTKSAESTDKAECRGGGSEGVAEHGIPEIIRLLDGLVVTQAGLVKQLGALQFQCTTPDLVPLPLPGHLVTDPDGYCRRDDEGKLHVIVRNQSGGVAGASKTSVSFTIDDMAHTQEAVLDTLDIAGFSERDVVFDVPPECYVGGICMFTIVVDSSSVVAETNEPNNTAIGRCFLVIL
jgi:hypothetical protein